MIFVAEYTTIRAVLDRPEQQRRRDGVVHHERNPVVVRHLRDRLEIRDVVGRVADGLDVEEPRVVVDQPRERVRGRRVGKPGLDPEILEGVGEQRVRPAVQGFRRHEVLPRARDVQHRQRDRRGTRRDAQRAHAAIQRGHTFFEHVGGRVHDARVDVSEFLEPEQTGRVRRVFEHV
jgi:hypothetical protein